MKTLVSIVLPVALALSAQVAAQSPANPYAGQQHRQIKALSEKEVDDYLNGRGMGTARVAELNSYPGPMHVLELADKLGLTQEQRARTEAIQRQMAENARRIGTDIVGRERELDALYASDKASSAASAALTQELGKLVGAYRQVHLDAHLAMRSLLSRSQIDAYDMLRGYTAAASHEMPGTNSRHGGHRH